MTAAVQWILNKSGVVFSTVKGAGLFYALSWHFTKERSLFVVCFPLLCLSDRVLIKMSIFPCLFLLGLFLSKILSRMKARCFYTYTLYCWANHLWKGKQDKVAFKSPLTYQLITSKTPLLPLNIYQDSALGRGAVWRNKFDSVQCHWLAIRRT